VSLLVARRDAACAREAAVSIVVEARVRHPALGELGFSNMRQRSALRTLSAWHCLQVLRQRSSSAAAVRSATHCDGVRTRHIGLERLPRQIALRIPLHSRVRGMRGDVFLNFFHHKCVNDVRLVVGHADVEPLVKGEQVARGACVREFYRAI